MKKPTVKNLPVNWKIIEILKKHKEIAYVKHALSAPWLEAIKQKPDHVRFYCNKKGVGAVTVSYESIEKFVTSDMCNALLYAKITNVRLISRS